MSKYHHGSKPDEEKVHSAYETSMMDQCAAEIIVLVNNYVKNKKATDNVEGGHAAAVYAVKLMRNSLETLPPLKLIAAFNKARLNYSHYVKPMFSQMVNGSTLGEKTAACIGEGCLALASLWKSAWEEGNGKEISLDEITEIERSKLKATYDNKKFLKSLRIDNPEFKKLLTNSTPDSN